MAFNWQTFKTRTLTAAIFVVVMLAGLLINRWTFFILFSIIHFGCWFEFVKLLKRINKKNFLPYSLLGLFYITMPLLMMIYLGITWKIYTINNTNEIIYNYILPCSIIFSLWINDTMAYIVGSLIGKTQMTKISPKKTWAGTIGGTLLCIFVISLIAYFTKLLSDKDASIIAALCAMFGTLGDLLESKLKRMAGVKDSGRIMPGHGGFLDRFDSLLVATPFVWLYVYFFMQ
jgi:phosphatidate cytidylyltransferase